MGANCDPDDAGSVSSGGVKRARYGSNNSASSASAAVATTSRFKGVVPQISGHWGAQIYANHQRIWLGTFKSEREAAMAYDSAAIKLRSSCDSHRNFPWSPVSMQEPFFQKSFTTEAVLSMIKDGSYSAKLSDFLSQRQQRGEQTEDDDINADGSLNNNSETIITVRSDQMEKFTCRKLFSKGLTPSDVGKLNRLVIPKKFAVKFFPGIMTSSCESSEVEDEEDVLLSFHDASMRLWKFRYCYWRSSQSFVFTRGWNRFVKDKGLRAKDVITFSMCDAAAGCVNDPKPSSFYLIDVTYRQHDKAAGGNEVEREDVVEREDADGRRFHVSRSSEVVEEEKHVVDDASLKQSDKNKKWGFRLFGVDI
uniref:Uncharacterized protein n=1 Tax=Kalanchoe fedtschenkoi TaxID=63787 RepID=A0A7N0SZK1_KALFE